MTSPLQARVWWDDELVLDEPMPWDEAGVDAATMRHRALYDEGDAAGRRVRVELWDPDGQVEGLVLANYPTSPTARPL